MVLPPLEPIAGPSAASGPSQPGDRRGRLVGRALKRTAAPSTGVFAGVFGIGFVGCCAAGLPVALALGIAGGAALAAGAGMLAIALVGAAVASGVAAARRRSRRGHSTAGCCTTHDAAAVGPVPTEAAGVDRGGAEPPVAGGVR